MRVGVGSLRSSAKEGRLTTSITGLLVYERMRLQTPWKGDQSLNSVYGRYALPLLEIEELTDGHQLVRIVTLGPPGADMPVCNGWTTDACRCGGAMRQDPCSSRRRSRVCDSWKGRVGQSDQ